MSLLLGIDCGGTETKLLLADDSAGTLRRVRSTSVVTPDGGGALGALGRQIAAFVADDPVAALAVTVPGIVTQEGQVRACSNVPWLVGHFPAHELGRRLQLDGECLNDGAAAAIAEAVLGAGREHSDIFVLALGTGIAGAHVTDGQVRTGAHGAAYEVGHVATGAGWLCSCGQRGCLETEIGGSFLGRRWDAERSTESEARAADVIRAARGGDQAAGRVLDRGTTALARSLLGIVAVIDPGAIVIGGGLTRSADLIVEPAARKMRELATFHQLPPVMTAELGMWAGAWGAAIRARRYVHSVT